MSARSNGVTNAPFTERMISCVESPDADSISCIRLRMTSRSSAGAPSRAVSSPSAVDEVPRRRCEQVEEARFLGGEAEAPRAVLRTDEAGQWLQARAPRRMPGSRVPPARSGHRGVGRRLAASSPPADGVAGRAPRRWPPGTARPSALRGREHQVARRGGSRSRAARRSATGRPSSVHRTSRAAGGGPLSTAQSAPVDLWSPADRWDGRAQWRTGEGTEVGAGPGAPHGAWPLVAADVGTRGCRGPAPTDDPNASTGRMCSPPVTGAVRVSRGRRGATAGRRPAGPRRSRAWRRRCG